MNWISCQARFIVLFIILSPEMLLSLGAENNAFEADLFRLRTVLRKFVMKEHRLAAIAARCLAVGFFYPAVDANVIVALGAFLN